MTSPERPPSGGRPGGGGLDERQLRQLAIIGGLVVVGVLVLAFIVENTDTVTVSFVFFSTRMSLIWVMLLTLVAGILLGLLISRLVRRRVLKKGE